MQNVLAVALLAQHGSVCNPASSCQAKAGGMAYFVVGMLDSNVVIGSYRVVISTFVSIESREYGFIVETAITAAKAIGTVEIAIRSHDTHILDHFCYHAILVSCHSICPIQNCCINQLVLPPHTSSDEIKYNSCLLHLADYLCYYQRELLLGSGLDHGSSKALHPSSTSEISPFLEKAL